MIGQSQDSVVIVSGLPRSGTSMMMQMIEAGGGGSADWAILRLRS